MARLFGEWVAQKVGEDKWYIALKPLPGGMLAYDEDYVTSLYHMFAKQLRGARAEGRAKRCILGYVSYGITDRIVLRAFQEEALVFPFSDTSGVVFEGKPPARVSEFVRKAITELRRQIVKAERALDAIEKEVQSAANRTPLLLPLRAFGADDVRKLLNHVREKALSADDPFGAVKSEARGFCSRFPRKAVSTDPKKYFVNKKGIVFKTPTGALHGSFDPDFFGDHDVEYFPRSSLRLGAGYEPGFHYDCFVLKSREFPTRWNGCHGQAIQIRSDRSYANVYPNDYVRG